MKRRLISIVVFVMPLLGWGLFFEFIVKGGISFIFLNVMCVISFVLGVLTLVFKVKYTINEKRICVIGMLISGMSLVYILLVPLLNKLVYSHHIHK
jgi:hypothetical protein